MGSKGGKTPPLTHFKLALTLPEGIYEFGYCTGMNEKEEEELGVTNRCRLFWLTNSALVYMSPNAGGWGFCGVSANEYSCAHGAQINFGDLTPYLTDEEENNRRCRH